MSKSRARASQAAGLLLAIATLAAVPAAASAAPVTGGPPPAGTLYVANWTAPSITEYPPDSNGDATPTATISGTLTGLSRPTTLALDPAGDLFVDDQDAQAIYEFAPGANGNVNPINTIQGKDTGLALPVGIALDAAGEIFVANETSPSSGSITEYPPNSNGDVPPTVTIPSTNFGGNFPQGIAISAAGDLFVSDGINESVYEFKPPFTDESAPFATLTGPDTGLDNPGELSFDPSGNLYVSNNDSITEYAANGGFSGDVTPVVNFSTSRPGATGFDSAGDLYIPADTDSGVYVQEYAPPLTTSSQPTATIEGNDTGLDDPIGVAIVQVGPPATLAFVNAPSGGTAGDAFSTQPTVAVEDANGNVIPTNTSDVTLSITPDTGTSGAALTCTANPVAASAGVATFAGCAISKAGTGYTLHATDGSLAAADSGAFDVSPGPADKLAFVVQPSSSSVGKALATQPAVAVEDAEGDVVTTNTSHVTLSITPDTGTGGAALTCAANPVAASAGVATFAGCAISKAGTGYQLHATDGSLAAADSAAFAISPGTAVKLAFVAQPSSSSAGQALSTQPAVAVEDAEGDVVTTNTSHVTLSITPETGASGAALTCAANPVAASAGVATFAGCAISKAGAGYELHATDGSLATADSAAFAISPGSADKLAFVTQPSSSSAGQKLGTQPAVAVEDAEGDVVTTNTSDVTLSITPGTGAGGAFLACAANPVAASAGVATFAGCAISKAGTGYTLHATDGSLATADSGAFAISPGPAARLVFVTQPSSSFAGQEFRRPPAVAVEDAEGDVVTTNTSQVTLSVTPRTGTSGAALSCAANPVAASAGVATFPGCAISEAGKDYRLTATDGGLAQGQSATFTVAQSPAIDHFTWSTTPIAAPGNLKPGQQVKLTVTALNAAGAPVRTGLVYLSLTKPAAKTEHPGDTDTASATCGPAKTKLPAYCPIGKLGQVQVTYTPSAQPYELGSDVLTAAVDPFGTNAAPDQYTYAAAPGTVVASYGWSPDPIAPAGTLPKGAAVKVTLMALDADGNPVASANVSVAFTPVPGDNAKLTPPGGACSGSQPKPLTCHTGKNGVLTFVYNPTAIPRGGSDGVTASYPVTRTGKPPAIVPAPVSDTYSYDKPGHYDWSTTPIAAPGSLKAGQQVKLLVTATNAAGKPAGNALVYLSLTKPRPVSGTKPDNASAACVTTTRIPLPGYCPANSAGQVRVAYTTSSNAVEDAADTLTAAVDPFGAGAATDQYVYPAKPGTAVASYSWSPAPIAPAATLAPGKAVPVTLTALDAEGIPVPGAPVLITIAQAPGSDAKLTPACGTALACVTGKDGSVTFRYNSSTTVPQGGSDGLTASQPKTVKTPPPPPATDSYTYRKAISHLTWSTDPIAAPGSLTGGQKVTLKVTALTAAGLPVAAAMVYVSLARPATEAVGDADNSSATCGTITPIRLPAYCRANSAGQVQVTYTASAHPDELGSDVLTAAVDPFGTDAAADRYTYLAPPGTAVASYSWGPDPLAAAEGLPARGTVQATLTALGAEGNPIAGASVAFAFQKAPGSDATLKVPALGCTGLTCRTGGTGTITVTYTSSGGTPSDGSDAIIASQPKKAGTAASPSPAADCYSYD